MAQCLSFFSAQPYKRPEHVLLLCSEATERTLLPVARKMLHSSTSGRLLSAAETGMGLPASTSEVRASTPSRDLRLSASSPEMRVSTANWKVRLSPGRGSHVLGVGNPRPWLWTPYPILVRLVRSGDKAESQTYRAYRGQMDMPR